jgi:predicted phosphoadenosine phosphosulfate sulfurtransferase
MNVYEKSIERIDYTFKNFDNIYLSFSGGKDSGVMLNLVVDYMRANNITKKIGLFHIDYEAQYQMTTDYVDLVYTQHKDLFDYYRVCMPLAVECCTSMSQGHWTPWDADKKDLWVRKLPVESINEENHEFDFYQNGMWDYDFQEKFIEWMHTKKKASKTACFVGIRTDESLNRWRAIHSDKNTRKFNGKKWTKEMATNMYNIYPIYDYNTEDVWVSNAKNEWEYNSLYDLFYQAGLTIAQMRVASPFISTASETLKLYKVIDPHNWGKMIGRVNGVNFTGLYGGTTAMGWRSIKLPKGHTWKSYLEFLLSTMPKESADNYSKKLNSSIEFWKNRGGCLSLEVIQKLKDLNIDIEVIEETNYQTRKKPVRLDYQDDISISEFKEIPTYKRMCICIMKNDHLCKYMGFSLTKTETQLRQGAEAKYKRKKEESK